MGPGFWLAGWGSSLLTARTAPDDWSGASSEHVTVPLAENPAVRVKRDQIRDLLPENCSTRNESQLG